MDRHGYAVCRPRQGDAPVTEDPTLPLTSGYIQRAKGLLRKQGAKKPWRADQNYALDVLALRLGAIDDGAVEFRRRDPTDRAA
jgi:monooxygenase